MASVLRRIKKSVRARQGFPTRAPQRVHGPSGRSARWMRPPSSGAVSYGGTGRPYADGFSPIVSGVV